MKKYDEHLLKTMGTLAARLVATLYSRNRSIFRFKEAVEILGGRIVASRTLSRLIRNGVVARMKSDLYCIVPFELGFEREYMGNPYIVARELVLSGPKGDQEQYYISHGSAFDLHQMVTQPQFIVYVSSPRMMRSRVIQGTEFRFVKCKVEEIFGIVEMWVDKSEKIRVSDLERTLIDGLKQPSYCGGFSEVAKAFSIKKQAINPETLIDYATILNVGAVIRRLGYLMELYQIGTATHWQVLQTKLTATYHLLDPELPAMGRHISQWRLRLNISQEELLTIGGT